MKVKQIRKVLSYNIDIGAEEYRLLKKLLEGCNKSPTLYRDVDILGGEVVILNDMYSVMYDLDKGEDNGI